VSVVAVKIYDTKIVVGADSQSTSYWHNKSYTNKIFKITDSFVIGGVGFTSHNQHMRLFCETNSPASNRERDIIQFIVDFNSHMKKKDDKYEPYNSWILVYDGAAYQIGSDLFIRQIKDYEAIGSGHEYAKSALHLGHSVTESLKVACDMTIYCGEPLEVYVCDTLTTHKGD
jgi:ATP-dependent protease HslVU (ClpYQ) peptidase subunit